MTRLGVAGWSGAGKTTLIEAILPRLRGRGLRVSTLKHAHAGFDMDVPGKDSFRHRAAGAHEVLVSGGARWALLHEGEETLDALVGRMEAVDLVLIEGFKAEPHRKIEVFRRALGKPPLWPGRADIVAVAADDPRQVVGPPALALDDPDAIVAWIVSQMHLPGCPARQPAASA